MDAKKEYEARLMRIRLCEIVGSKILTIFENDLILAR